MNFYFGHGEPSFWFIDSIHPNLSEDKSSFLEDNILIKTVHYTDHLTPSTKKIAVDKKVFSATNKFIDFGKAFGFYRDELGKHYKDISFKGRTQRLPYFDSSNIDFLQKMNNEILENELRAEIEYYIERAGKTEITKNTDGGDDILPKESKKTIAKIFVFNVGQGESILIELPAKELWMIDAYFVSRSRFSYNAFTNWMNEHFKGLSIKRFVLSHLHHDHIRSAHKIIDNFNVEEVIFTPSLKHPSPTVRNLFRHCKARGVLKALAGDEIKKYPGLNVTLKRTCDFHGGLSLGTDPNYHGVAMFLETEESFAFFPGDIPALLLNNLQNYFCRVKNKNYRFYKVTHHCSQTGNHSNFLNMLNPTDAVTSCARMNSFGHPSTPPKNIIDKLTNLNHRITGFQEEKFLPYFLV